MLLLGPVAFSQKPGDVIDPHENPAVQNAPEGKKDSPGTNSPTKPGIPPVIPAKPSAAKKAAAKTPAKPKQAQVAVRTKPVDPEQVMLGTWILVTKKSTFNPGPAPQSEVRTYARTPNGIMATTTTTLPDGKTSTVTFPWQPDGKEHLVTGSELLDTIRLERVNDLTSEATLSHGSKVIASERRTLTEDGKTLTIEVTDTSSEDRPIKATAVYEKQP